MRGETGGDGSDYTWGMLPLRRSMPSLCLTLILGLALAWPGLAHRRLHQHTDEHPEDLGGAPVSAPSVGSESHDAEHPHLDLIATAPTKAALHLALFVSEHPTLAAAISRVVRVSTHANESIRPRAPPSGPRPPIRAPPTA